MTDQIDPHILKRYQIVSNLGKGAYGVVWKATDLKTGQVVALKKAFDAFNNPTDAQRTYREVTTYAPLSQVTFLKHLKHPNIVRLLETLPADNQHDLYMVFEYMDTDLHVAIRAKILQPVHRRYIIYQLFKALKYIHSSGMIHRYLFHSLQALPRDLKPANILLDSECRIKIADFGLARMVGSLEHDILTDYVATRWFRAPEILLGSKSYSFGVDLWSIGCMAAEMILGKALFSGTCTLNQLEKIVETIGYPTAQEIQALGGQTQIFANMPRLAKSKLNALLNCEPDELDLIQRLLAYDPHKRLSVDEALKHPYLREFHNGKEEPVFKGRIVFQLQDDKQYPISAYRDVLYKKLDYTKILNLINQQKKMLEDGTNKTSKPSSKYVQNYLSQQYTKSSLMKSNSTMLLERTQNKTMRMAQTQSQSSIKSKLKMICQQTNALLHNTSKNSTNNFAEPRMRSGVSKQSSSSKQILNNVTNTSLSPSQKLHQRQTLNRLFQK